MPQVDLETLVSACTGVSSGHDRKIACEETLAGGDRKKDDEDEAKENPDQAEVPPDFPPESFWLSKDAEFDWFDRNAFFERKESTKGSSNSTNLNPNLNPNSNSQRFPLNLKSKASILGLPKPQKTCFVDAKNRRNSKPGNIRLFPKRSGSVGKSDSLVEPSSPKVSCMGRVRSKRDRNRMLKNRTQSKEPAVFKDKDKPVAKHTKHGFFSTFRSIFGTGCRKQPAVIPSEPAADHSPPKKRVTTTSQAAETDSIPRISVDSEAPGLGGMMRFASGRRSDSWGGGEAGKNVP